MAKATIYTTMFCGHCTRAMSLLQSKGVDVEELAAGFCTRTREEMIERSGGARTFPQIFIGERHVGGFDALRALDAEGRLDDIIAEADR